MRYKERIWPDSTETDFENLQLSLLFNINFHLKKETNLIIYS